MSPFLHLSNEVNRLAAKTRVLDGSLLLLLSTILLSALWPVFGTFTVGAVGCGLVLSVALRTWYNAHPLTRYARVPLASRRPEINFSAQPVAGDVGGLLFACGALVILVFGVPGLHWFFAVSMLCAAIAAGALIAWRRSHASSLENHAPLCR